MICYVTRYDPRSYRPVGEAVPVEADTKAQAAEQVCGFKVARQPRQRPHLLASVAWAKSQVSGNISVGQFELRSRQIPHAVIIRKLI